MKLQLADLAGVASITQVTIHSIDWMIYQVSLEIDGKELLLYAGEAPFRSRNLLQIKELFETLPVTKYRLGRPTSAYDEMVGQPTPMFSDALETELFWQRIDAVRH
ncbi:DUF6482 family protein [Neptuniibacter sp. CAU 1671]|uniref:DUF6482 family protein n=1 Tax=Neptuniibacter sp. CAU 1671 TaxID=3032593 RepID=UPI0023DB9105|nr:DUF6482 family protein [Neptuniibacter sp. CAU 1671]MDF2182104.1 DUF6482 family protein [Neptuniibacter sp. CAU 1671]